MKWKKRFERYKNIKAIQVIQWTWIAFAAFALGFALPGIPHYLALLQTPCNATDCLDAQLTFATVQSWVAIGVKLEDFATSHLIFLMIIDVLLVGTAAFLIWRKADNRASVVAAFVGTALATSTLSQALANYDPRFLFPAHLILYVQMAGLLPLFYLIPDGHFRPDWMRWAALAYIIANGIYLSPDFPNWITPGTIGYCLWLILESISLVAVIANLFSRFRHAKNSIQQEQMVWVLASISLAGLYVLSGKLLRQFYSSVGPMDVFNVGPATEFFGMFLAVGSFTCLLVALVNYEPVNFKIFINRALVYVALTAFVIAAYGLIVGYLGTAFHSENILFSLIATGLIAILFQPLRERLQRAVNRLMYGERSEPYRLLNRLAQRLEFAFDRNAALPLATETIAQALKLPYVAIKLKQNGSDQIIAAYGIAQDYSHCFPLAYAGETIGELVAATRAGEETFTPADLHILGDLTRQIGPIAHAALVSADLEQARLHIVEAREETRRRLGSDLHDGVGHQITALARQIDQASNLLKQDPDAAQELLSTIRAQLNLTSAGVRQLAHQLYPPELELLGLVGALQERIDALSSPDLVIRMELPEPLPPLPTAVESTAYYIALEALTNVSRHADARSCHLRLAVKAENASSQPPMLEIEIRDDGRGLSPDVSIGLGRLSMQARAAEVGGECTFAANLGGGTLVTVRLPCHC